MSRWFTKTCTICTFPSASVLYNKGLCYQNILDYIFYTVQRENGIGYEGYKVYSMKFDNDTWTVDSRKPYHGSKFKLRLKDEIIYLAGRKNWSVEGVTGCPGNLFNVNLREDTHNFEEKKSHQRKIAQNM